jgi:dephospho-CoA kinase
MSITPTKIVEDAIQLTPQERISIADALIQSINTPEAEISPSLLEAVEKSIKSIQASERLSVYGL